MVPVASIRSRHELPVVTPFRLDLTVSALRRLPTNLVDVLAADGTYVRAFAGARAPLIARVTQRLPDVLAVAIEGDARDAGEHARALALVRRALGADRDLSAFGAAAAALSWLHPLAQRMVGIKPPRYGTLWEACVNAVVFQQVSLHAASAIVGRMIASFGTRLESEGTPLYLFPSVERVLGQPDDSLRATGLSAGKVATLRRVGTAMLAGSLDQAMLEQLPSAEAAALLRDIKGIGPWTANVILLRGFGRLDVFPMDDSGVARSLALVAGEGPLDLATALATLGSQQGLLYYHLLLARLEMRGELGTPSVPARRGSP